MRRMLRTVFLEVPTVLYADLDTGTFGSRGRMVLRLAVAVGASALVGAGAAAALGRDVADGAVVGAFVGLGACLLLLVLTLSLVAGSGMWAMAAPTGDRAAEGRSTRGGHRAAPVLFVIAAFAGIVGGLVTVTTGVAALDELPFRGERATATGTVVAWEDRDRGRDPDRVFLVEYEVDGAPRTGELAIEDSDLTLSSEIGDRTRLEYVVDHPERIRRAGEAESARSTLPVLGAVGVGLLVVAPAAGAVGRRLA
ncbi:hypothetical protein AB6N23_15925 [Cellulomonas sp. 179-A 9B4 NHS]|uniref:hypothetical protein n=1 Tax=Cellulomonas sp. 179-A 9B4 NHS TaxID=3142379 RepID=UPI0039A1DF9D